MLRRYAAFIPDEALDATPVDVASASQGFVAAARCGTARQHEPEGFAPLVSSISERAGERVRDDLGEASGDVLDDFELAERNARLGFV